VALAHERPSWKIIACDISLKALKIAELNAHQHSCRNIQFEQRNTLEGFLPSSLDAIVSNPPYIEENDPALELHVKQYEPTLALIAEDQGYRILFQIANEAQSILKPGGWLIMEHGQGQEKKLREYLQTLGYSLIQSQQDMQGIARLIIAQATGSSQL
jgi:release factor glutamine methyltransferase